MKNSEHLPVYGAGPLCVYSMLALAIIGIILERRGLLASGEVHALSPVFILFGAFLIILGIFIWCRALFAAKIGKAIVDNRLLTQGIYAWVRNPIYSAAAIGFTGLLLLFSNLWLLLLPPLFWLDITVLVKLTEEKWLLGLYGDEYRSYCSRVNRVLPWFPRQ